MLAQARHSCRRLLLARPSRAAAQNLLLSAAPLSPAAGGRRPPPSSRSSSSTTTARGYCAASGQTAVGGGVAAGKEEASATPTTMAPPAAAADAGATTRPPRGAFIVFEGLDRCGKTTQSARLLADLRAKGLDAELWRFPERDPTRAATGPLIDAYLKKKPVAAGDAETIAETNAAASSMDDAAAHLLFSANRWERRPALITALKSGRTIVADRYAHSGVAYSAAKKRGGMGREWCAAPDAGLPAPDVVVFLDAGGGGGLAARGGYGEERYEVPAFQAEVARQFEALLAFEKEGGGGEKEKSGKGGVRCARVDARGTVDEVAAAVAAAVDPALEEARAGAPVRRLWDGETLALGDDEEEA